MKVKVADNLYQMSRKEFRGLLEIASEQVPFGIYAVEKKDYAELCNQKCRSTTELKRHRHNLKQQGFKVYSNG